MAGIDIKQLQTQTKTKSVKTDSEGGWFDFLNKDIELGGSGFGDKKKERFYAELSILFSSGVDIKSALELIELEQRKKKDKTLMQAIKNAVIGGVSLSVAMEQTGKFSAYEFYSIQIGEETGQLVEVLQELTSFFGKKLAQKRQILNALSYPAIVITVAMGAVFFMMRFMVPMFADVFLRFGGDLPDITKFIIDFSDTASNNFHWLIIGIATMLIAIYTQRKKSWFRKYSAAVILRLPFIGTLVRKIYLARFCNSMRLLIGAKVPMLRAIELLEKMISFYPIEVALEKVRQDIMKGTSLHESLFQHAIFNQRMVSLIKVGEEVNQLESMFGKLNQQYSDDVQQQTAMISSLLEPVMIIFLGLVVGTILVAMYLPLFELSTNFR